MLVLERPILAPGCCILCRSDLGPVVDIGRDEEWVGRWYICFPCCIELGQLAGCVPGQALDQERALAVDKAARLVSTDKELVAERALSAALLAVGFKLRDQSRHPAPPVKS